ncbi:MAG: 50S ribosomal protein L18 [Candidatus Calescibacterium sp.]|nr:50S ribosomal protein L18 [Candidatus Calescibacterium sp.]MDW8132187.1 50S ribosomal protein L18 [Candidatus Calescibacterium sp.]
MIKKISRNEKRKIRHKRLRKKIKGNPQKPRCNVFRSNKNIYLSVIDDTTGRTLTYSNSLEKDIKDKYQKKEMKYKDIVIEVASRLAERCKKLNINKLVFDRGGYKYHGNIKKIADTLREKGIQV